MVPSDTADLLKMQRNVLILEREIAKHWEEHDLIFSSRHGKPINRKVLWDVFKTLIEKVEVPDMQVARPYYGLEPASALKSQHNGKQVHPCPLKRRVRAAVTAENLYRPDLSGAMGASASTILEIHYASRTKEDVE